MNDEKKAELDNEIKEEESELQAALSDSDSKTVFMVAMQNGATVEEATKMAKTVGNVNKIREQNSIHGQVSKTVKEQLKIIIPIMIISSGSAIATWWDKIIDSIKN